MEHPGKLLALPVRTTARWVALRRLDEAETAAADGDPDALLAALRGLGGTLEAFRPALADTVRRRHRRVLRDLLAEGDALDEATQLLGWTEHLLADEIEAGGAADCEPLLAELRDRHAAAVERFSRAGDDLPRLAPRLRRRLSRYRVAIGPEPPEPPRSTAHALAAALAAAAASARSRDAGRGDARAPLRRLRALLEPFAGELPGAELLMQEVEWLATMLSHRATVAAIAAEVDARAPAGPAADGLLLLARRARAGREEVRIHLEERWEPLLAHVEKLAAELGGAGEDVEIERKYLLSGLPALPEGAELLEVEQGWFGEKIAERVRRVRSAEGERAYRSIKHGRGVKRLELEEPISPALFDVLWPLTEGRRVRKRRFRSREGELCWEIDQFTDRELVLAEVELPTVDHPIVFPAWLAPLVVREVTGEPAYVNLNLAG